MARVPFLQEGIARDPVQETGLAHDADGVLVPPLPVALEHLDDVQRLSRSVNCRSADESKLRNSMAAKRHKRRKNVWFLLQCECCAFSRR